MRALDAELERRLAAARREHPEWASLLDLYQAALAEDARGAWEVRFSERLPGPARAPGLHGMELEVDGRRARSWLDRLLPPSSRSIDPLALLEAALRRDDALIDRLAAAIPVETGVLRVTAQVASFPLLHACRRALEGEARAAWKEGYCPVCGAWPVLSEYVGIERKRGLRCGGCGGGWEIPWLRCPFCGEAGHEKLGYLATVGGEGGGKIEVCESCKGYLKAVIVIRGTPPNAVFLEDLRTVPLDLAALERGYRRPEGPARLLEVRVRPKARGGLGTRLGAGRRGQ